MFELIAGSNASMFIIVAKTVEVFLSFNCNCEKTWRNMKIHWKQPDTASTPLHGHLGLNGEIHESISISENCQSKLVQFQRSKWNHFWNISECEYFSFLIMSLYVQNK